MIIKFSQNLRSLREAAAWTQSELAQKLQTTQRKISYWESGSIQPDIENLWKIADLFGLSVDELIGRSEF